LPSTHNRTIAIFYDETSMRRLLSLCLLLIALPAGAGLFDSRPSPSVLGAPLNNSADFLPVREAFRLSLVEPSAAPTASTTAAPSAQAAQPAQSLKLRFVAAEGYYLYKHSFQFSSEPAAIGLGDPSLPAGEDRTDEFFGDVQVYYGVLDIDLPLTDPAHPAFTLSVRYQGCADKGLCYPPETQQFEIAAGALAGKTSGSASAGDAGSGFLSNSASRSSSGSASTSANTNTAEASPDTAATLATNSPAPLATPWRWSELALFFLAGLGLTFTPCVLPMLPILSGVVLRGQPGGMRGFSLGLAYVLPMALCFALLGALMGVFGAGLNLQARLQSAWVLLPFSVFFVLFALSMFGVFELRLPRVLSRRLDHLADHARGGSLGGAALLGVVSSLLVSPCVSAPLAGALLYISASGDALGGALKLFALGLGMGAPLLLFATGGGALLPKSGNWMLLVRNAFGVMLLAVAVWMLERILPGPLALALWGLLAAGVALFLGTLELGRKTPQEKLAQLAGLVLLVYALAAATGALQGQDDPLRPLGRGTPGAQLATASVNNQWLTVTSPAELKSALAAAKAANQPLLLDWYADWCVSCKVLEREVLNAPAVTAQLVDYRLIRFDITDSNAAQRALLDTYQLFGPPALLLFAGDGQEWLDLRVVGEIDAEGFAERLRQAADRS
jgi:thiol:disulfide interchange protein DsbD